MVIQKFFSINKYYILPLVVGIGQFIGINIYISILIIGSLSLILTFKIKKNLLADNKSLLLFIILAIFISLINIYRKIPDNYSLLVWGQFIFIATIPLIIKDTRKLLNCFMHIILIIFLLDLLVNLAVLVGINIPGIIIAKPRPGELFPRMQGILNSNLFSSSISFLFLCLIMDRNFLIDHKYIKFLFLFLAVFNIILAGANRTFILSLVIIFIKLFSSFRTNIYKNRLLILTVVSIVVIFTFLNAFSNTSNLLRSQLWIISIEKIIQKPFLGYGIYFPDASKVVANIESLSEMVVTESFLLAIAYSYGIITLIFFIIFMFKLLSKANDNQYYTYQYAIFLGLSIELFFGGTLSNTLSTFVYFLSAYTIVENNKQLINSSLSSQLNNTNYG